MTDPEQTPIETPAVIPSAAGIVGKMGKSPLPRIIDLDGDGIADYKQHWFWDKVLTGLGIIASFTSPSSGFATYYNRYRTVAKSAIDQALP